jgi:hypothetical protein
MSTVATPEDIGNMALDLLTEGQIDSLDEDTKPARILNRWYEIVREGELMMNTWAFATIYGDETDFTTDTGDGEFQYLYEVPDDFLRFAWLTQDGFPNGVPINHTLWADGIRTNFAGPIRMPYVANVTDPGDMDALFTKAFAASLAIPLAHGLTGKQSMVQTVMGYYDQWVAQARRINSIMKYGRTPTTGWQFERGDLRYWRA